MQRREYATDLTDADWLQLAPLIPDAKPGGRPRKYPMREVLNAIFYYAMNVQYTMGSYGGVAQGYTTPQDWSSNQAIEFWFNGGNSGNTIRLEVSDNRAAGSTTDTSERFEYKFVDNWAGWRYISVPWSSFTRRTDWQPAGAPNDGFTLTQIWGFNFAPIK
jgi:endo-1,3-1,4-beta-glycanase ExoK